MGLTSGDRAAREDAVRRLEALSKQDLLALAATTVQANQPPQGDAIHVFHKYMALAQEKGFSMEESVALLDEPRSFRFKLALLDWMREVGMKTVSPADAITLPPRWHLTSQVRIRISVTDSLLTRSVGAWLGRSCGAWARRT